MDAVKEVVEKLNSEWTQFKSENDRRLKEIESKGKADPITEEKIDKHSSAIGELQKQLDLIQKQAQRIGATEASDVANEAKSAHSKAFNAYVRKGKNEDELAELQVKTLRVNVDADGGFAVPEAMDLNVGTMVRQLSPMESEVSVINAGGETYEKLFADGMAGSGWVGEESARPETASPTLASFKPAYGEVYANPKATQKMLDDAFFDVERWLESEIAEKFSQDVDLAIVSGDGVNKPKGVLAYTLATTGDATRAYGTIQKIHSGVAGDFTADNLLDLILALRPAYRQGAKFVLAGTTGAKIRKVKDANGQYIWAPGLAPAPATLFGYGITEDENMPVIAAGANAVMFGNLKRAYKLVNVKGIRTLRDPYTAKPYVHFYTTKRVGGGVEDTRAVKVLTLAV